MPKNYDAVDFYFTRSGDYVISPEGGVYDTSDDKLRSLVQEVRTRLKSDLGDWRLYPDIGAGVSSMIGEPNNKFTADTIKAKILSSISQYGLVDTRDISIRYMPIDPVRILFRIRIIVAATPENYFTESLNLQIIYNYSDSNLHVL